MEGASGNNDSKTEQSRCFVCDAEIRGRYYALATCITQTSRCRVIEKLGELVGERYMVVISEDDVICRTCANFINTLDRLEIEMRNVREQVLRFLEQKYSLAEGELLGDNNKPKPSQPPQITKCDAKESTNCCTKQSEINLEACSKDGKKRSHLWLQCDKCKYTTNLNSFMMNHIRDHIKQGTFCDKCRLYVPENQKETEHNYKTNESENKENEKDNSVTVTSDDPIGTTFLLQKITRQSLPSQTTPPPLISLPGCNHLYASNILIADSNPTSSKQPLYTLTMDVDDIDDSNERMKLSEPSSANET